MGNLFFDSCAFEVKTKQKNKKQLIEAFPMNWQVENFMFSLLVNNVSI